MSYSNEGYLAAGYVLEKATGRDFDEAVRDLVLEPLGMVQSAFRLTPEVDRRLAQGYGSGGRPVAYEEDMMRPAANLLVSPHDMARYLAFWLGRGVVDGRRLLSRDGVSRIEARRTLSYEGPDDQYGLGTALRQIGGLAGRGHAGFTSGFVAAFGYLTRPGVGWAVLLNRSDSGGALAAIEEETLGFLVQGERPFSVAQAPADGEALGSLTGFYRDATPGEQFTAPLVALGGLHVSLRGGGLAVREDTVHGLRDLLFSRRPWARLLPAGGGAFRREGDAASTLLFVRTRDGRDAIVTGGGYLERAPFGAAWLARALLAGAVLCMLSALALAPPSLVAWWRGGPPAHVWVRVLPVLASLVALALWAVVTRSPQPWGRLNATTAGIWALSWVFAALSILALAAAVAVPAREMGVLAKLHSLLVSAACSGLTAFAWSAGWIGIRTWRW